MFRAPVPKTARFFALALAVVAFTILIAKLSISSTEHGSIFSALAHLSQFFTILTNVLVVITLTLIGIGRRLPRGFVEAIVVAIVCVGGIYHLLLGHLSTHQGMAMVTNHGLHTIVPILTFLWWLLFYDKSQLSWGDAVKVMLWPLIYVVYIVIRAQWSNFYPYHFIDLEKLGVVGFLGNLVGLACAFFVLGVALIAMAKHVGRKDSVIHPAIK